MMNQADILFSPPYAERQFAQFCEKSFQHQAQLISIIFLCMNKTFGKRYW